MKRASLVLLTMGAALVAPSAARAATPRPPSWAGLLTRDEVGASAWSKAHPTWDGRGVVLAVLDTGVDPSVPGLDALPPGAGDGPKVIGVRDFSGEGHVALVRPRAAVEAGVKVLRREKDGDLDALVVRGWDALPGVPARADELWLGALTERALKGGEVDDLDRDGRRDGRFAVLVYTTAAGPVAVVDTDGDGDLAGEAPRRSYESDPRWFVLGRPADPLKDRAPVAVAVHIALDERRVELHFDSGGHGSHCAGIAAGWRIEGQEGFDGIAPGARILSLKIGHNALAGGATTPGSMLAALRYASRWALERQTPVVVNLSYGVGSEREGHGAIDKALDEELAKNPWLAVATSGGNEGPGLSSLGSPAAATLAWTSAAMLTEQQARTLFGSGSKGRKVFAFSSRGGELDKPDGLAPGTAWSTVPPFERSAVKSGTSMAAPQAAGVHLLLASAALASALPWTSGLAHRALETGARPIAGYAPLDQGAGLIDVGRAWDAYRKEAAAAGATKVAGWRVTTAVPGAPGRTASASYWRVGRLLPEPNEAISFKVQPLLYTTVAEDAREKHLDTFTLTSDVGWLRADRSELALRGTAAGDLVVRMDAAALAGRPGVHVGRVRAATRGVHAFDLPVVVVVPEALDPGTWDHAFASKLAPGDVARVFVQVPPGATSMTATLSVSGKSGAAWLLPFDPGGRHVEIWEHQASAEEAQVATFARAGEALAPGTWELCVYAPHKNPSAVDLALDVAFRALEVPATVTYTIGDGGAAEGELVVRNRLDVPFRGAIDVVAIGMERDKKVDFKAAKGTVGVTLGPEVGAGEVTLEVDEATWERMTDIAVNVTDGAGAVVAQTGFGQRRTRFVIDAGPGTYTLHVTGALTDPDDTKGWSMRLVERHVWRAPKAFDVGLPSGMAKATLLPDVALPLALSLPGGLPERPDGFVHVVVITLTGRDGATWARLERPLAR